MHMKSRRYKKTNKSRRTRKNKTTRRYKKQMRGGNKPIISIEELEQSFDTNITLWVVTYKGDRKMYFKQDINPNTEDGSRIRELLIKNASLAFDDLKKTEKSNSFVEAFY